MRTATIKDSCVCGALFTATGPETWIGSYHRDWMKQHTECRERIKSITRTVAAEARASGTGETDG